MTVSTRTPEGLPFGCPVCGKTASLEPSYPGGDSVCPSCGHLLWLFRDRMGQAAGVPLVQIRLETLLSDELGLDSLDLVELVMDVEAETGVIITDDAAERFRTVRDVIEYIRRRQEGDAA